MSLDLSLICEAQGMSHRADFFCRGTKCWKDAQNDRQKEQNAAKDEQSYRKHEQNAGKMNKMIEQKLQNAEKDEQNDRTNEKCWKR